MRRTQMYFDDDVWNILHARAAAQGTTISHLVREAVREKYLGKLEERRQAMEAFAGIRKDRTGLGDSTRYVRRLRRGSRLNRLGRR